MNSSCSIRPSDGCAGSATMMPQLSPHLFLSRALYRSLSLSLCLSLSLSPAISLCFLASLLFVANHQASHLQAIRVPYLVCLPQLWLVNVALTISYIDYLPVLTFPTDLSNRMLLLYSMSSRWQYINSRKVCDSLHLLLCLTP